MKAKQIRIPGCDRIAKEKHDRVADRQIMRDGTSSASSPVQTSALPTPPVRNASLKGIQHYEGGNRI